MARLGAAAVRHRAEVAERYLAAAVVRHRLRVRAARCRRVRD